MITWGIIVVTNNLIFYIVSYIANYEKFINYTIIIW